MRAVALVLAAALAGCGDAPPPPAQNPLLFENLKPIALYDHIEKAETAMVGEAAKLKTTCRKYLVSKAKAAVLGVPASVFKIDARMDSSCEPYRAQLARRLSAHTDMSISAAMLTDPLVWAKYADGRHDSFFRYSPPEEEEAPEASAPEEPAKDGESSGVGEFWY